MVLTVSNPRYGNVFINCDNFAELRSVSTKTIQTGYSAIAAGALSPADGLGGMLVWDATSTASDDGQTVVAPADGSPGRWHKIAVGQVGPQGQQGQQGAASTVPGPPGEGLATVMSPTGSALVGYKNRTVAAKLNELEVTPEDFGAKGDGVADDAPAIQAALDAIKATGFPGRLLLTAGARYRCNSGLIADRGFHNIFGYAVLDFSNGFSGVCLRWEGGYTAFGNSNGQNGCMEGQIVIAAGGPTSNAVGILFDTSIVSAATCIRLMGVTVANVGTSFQIGNRGYNQEFYNCKSFGFGVCFDWLANAADNDERIDVFGGTFYNGELFLQNARGAGRLAMHGGSIDYTSGIATLNSGKAEFNSVHFESNRWLDAPVKLTGNGAKMVIRGGWFLQQTNTQNCTNYFQIDDGCAVKMLDVITNNTRTINTPDPLTPTTWARGAGRFEMHGTEPAFEFATLPACLSTTSNFLSNGAFQNADLNQDNIWRNGDTNSIVDRYGATTPSGAGAANNLVLSQTASCPIDNLPALKVVKNYGSTSAASFVLLSVPVRYGDKVVAGFLIAGNASDVIVTSGFARMDGQDANGVPIVRRFAPPGDIHVTPSSTAYTLVALTNATSAMTAPAWATHYNVVVNLVLAGPSTTYFRGLWASTL